MMTMTMKMNMIVLRPNNLFLLLAFVVGILGSTIFVVNAESGTGIREMVKSKCDLLSKSRLPDANGSDSDSENESESEKRQLSLKTSITFEPGNGGEQDDVDNEDSFLGDTIWRHISRSSVGSMQMSVEVISSLPQPSSSGEDQPAALCGYLDGLVGFEVLECRGYTVAGFMNVCDESILETVESHADVTGIGPNYKGETSSASSTTGTDGGDRFTGSGTVKSQAISALQIIALLEKYPLLTGEGMKIGIISDSFDNPSKVVRTTEADDIATRNLPSEADGNKVIVLREADSTQNNRKDEGRAIAQLIYDLIPKAQMYFYTGALPQGNFAEAIEALVAEGVDIIVDDIAFPYEPIFQLGFSAQAANEAAKKGIPYFAAAGNKAARSYETIYKPTECSVGPRKDKKTGKILHEYKSCLDFGDRNDKQVIVVSVPTSDLLLFWEIPYESVSGPNASSDLFFEGPPQPPTVPYFDFYLFNNTEGSEDQSHLFVSDLPRSLGSALQGVTPSDFVNEFTTSYYIVIAERSGASEDATGLRIKWLGRGAAIESINPGLYDKPTVIGTGNAPFTAAVAAASDQQTFGNLVPELFTSLGGVPILFDEKGVKYPVPPIYRQPRFTGPDGSFNTFFGNEGTGLTVSQKKVFTPPRFYGTSASAPNVAAVGIILLQACKMYGNNRRLKIDDEDEDRYKDDERRKMKRKLKSESQRSKSKKDSTKSSKSKSSKSKRRKPFDCTKPSNIYKLLETTAIDMLDPGYDFLTGYGYVNALAAVDKLIELINDPVAADEFERKLDHADDLNEDEEEKHCPIGSFLNPITSSISEEFENPTDSPTASPTDSPTASQSPSASPTDSPAASQSPTASQGM